MAAYDVPATSGRTPMSGEKYLAGVKGIET